MSGESQVAKTIFAQLGGGQFRLLTGSKCMADGDNTLIVSLPYDTSAKDNIRKILITLNSRDLYDMKFMTGLVNQSEPSIVAQYSDVYADMLVELFEKTTGLFVHF
ncbi:hypothetical protein ACI2KR_06525 [Pseudomonas luteola]